MKLLTYQSLVTLAKQIDHNISLAGVSRNDKHFLSLAGAQADELSRKVKEYLEQGIE